MIGSIKIIQTIRQSTLATGMYNSSLLLFHLKTHIGHVLMRAGLTCFNYTRANEEWEHGT